MPKYAARVDANQKEVVSFLRAVGYFVWPTHTAGRGFPDLVVSGPGWVVLLEVKDGSKPPSGQRLTPAERDFFASFPGPVFKVRSPEQAVQRIERWRSMSERERADYCHERRARYARRA